MTITIELAPEIEELARAKAQARGLSLETYLTELIAQAVQQEAWKEMPEDKAGRLL